MSLRKGDPLSPRNPKKKRQFLRAIDIVQAKLHFTSDFKIKQPHFFNVFMSLLQVEAAKCKWKSIGAEEKDAVILNGSQDIRKLLLDVQRVPRGSLAFSAKSQRARPPRPL
jgi:hypothetical protein